MPAGGRDPNAFNNATKVGCGSLLTTGAAWFEPAAGTAQHEHALLI
jgi:hypothetical protein